MAGRNSNIFDWSLKVLHFCSISDICRDIGHNIASKKLFNFSQILKFKRNFTGYKPVDFDEIWKLCLLRAQYMSK